MSTARPAARPTDTPPTQARAVWILAGVLGGVWSVIGGCTQGLFQADEPVGTPRPAAEVHPEPAPHGAPSREVFPHVRFDSATKVVEFDGEVAIDCHHPKTPRVYLEVTACTRDSKEHESLVVTDAKPSHVHAALLLAGLEPGEPGRWTVERGSTRKSTPRGAAVEVTIAWHDAAGNEQTSRAADWVVGTKGARLGGSFVFAGSRIVPWQGREHYNADGTGTLIGLATFGDETVAYSELISPESSLEEPEWIADAGRVPATGTLVVVRITGAGER